MGRVYVSNRGICTGCGACLAVCPNKAIDVVEDNLTHFMYPMVDENKCIGCDLCRAICPVLVDANEINSVLGTFAAYNKQIEDRMKSASGGMFRVLAAQVLSMGGAVAGVKYCGPAYCKHVVIDSESELDELCGTKYFQSDTTEVYVELEKASREHETVMFCGTPCQVDGVRKWASTKGFLNKLLTVEILCRGVAPAFLQKKYIDYLENKSHKKINSIRYKEKTRGWNKIGTMVTFTDGSSEYIKNSENEFLWLEFSGNYSVRESCLNCRYKSTYRTGDITIGDFWGYPNDKLVDNYGISFLLVNTEKGRRFFEDIKKDIHFSQELLNDVVMNNKNGFSQITCDLRMRDVFWKMINADVSIGDATSYIKYVDNNKYGSIKKDKNNISLFERWVEAVDSGIAAKAFFEQRRVHEIAIYGYGMLGKAFYKVIKKTDIRVGYIIDRNKDIWETSECAFYSSEDELPSVDMVIVTAINAYVEIVEQLKIKMDCEIISIEEFIRAL